MDGAVEMCPLPLALFIVFQLHMGLGPYESHLLSYLNDLGEERSINALVLPFGHNANKQHIQHWCGFEVYGLSQMPPTEGEEFSLSLLNGTAQTWHAYTSTDDFSLGIFHNRKETAVKHLQEATGIPLHLLVIKLAVAVKICISAIDDTKYLLFVPALAYFLLAAEVTEAKAVTLLCYLCYAEVFGVVCLMFPFGNKNFMLYPADFLLET